MPVNCLTHLRALTSVPDPVHGNFQLNLFDRDIVDSPYFQRLHHVYQNSANYVSFPSNKNSRFCHSLGVAHLGSKMFSNALSNSKYGSLEAFLKIAARYIENLLPTVVESKHLKAGINPLESAHFETISGLSKFIHSPITTDTGTTEQIKLTRINTEQPYGTYNLSSTFIVDTLWQAVRYYGFIHDLGHLPMSHSFENGLQKADKIALLYSGSKGTSEKISELVSDLKLGFSGELASKRREKLLKVLAESFTTDGWKPSIEQLQSVNQGKEIHEARGINLFIRFIDEKSSIGELVLKQDKVPEDDLKAYCHLIQRLTLAIYYSIYFVKDPSADNVRNCHPYSFLYAVRQLIDGEVDSDRLDYTIRDCREAGVHIGLFDLDRIANNCVLIQNKKRQMLFNFGFHFRAISGIEQFFEARYQSYKYMIFSRTSGRSNLCIERLVSLIFVHAFLYPNKFVSKQLARYKYTTLCKGKIEKVVPEDDKSVLMIEDYTFRSLLLNLNNECKNQLKGKGTKTVSDEKRLLEDIANLSEIVLFRNFAHIYTLSKNQPGKNFVQEHVEQRFLKKHGIDRVFETILSRKNVELRKQAVHNIHENLTRYREGNSIILMYQRIGPKIFKAPKLGSDTPFEGYVYIQNHKGYYRAITGYSNVLREMAQRSDYDIRVYAVSNEIKRDPSFFERFENEVKYNLNDFLHKSMS